ncbi:MAG: 50S ribosomal protein L3 N(5)-glutamine methyltransferase [Xanthobacteraceae bacterium]
MKRKRTARKSRTRVARLHAPATVNALVRTAAARLKRAKVVFAHGTTDPAAEAAFIVAETLKIHPDRIEALAGRGVPAAQQQAIEALVARRIETRKPAAYLLKRIYMHGVPFHIDERAIVPRSYIGEILDDELFETLIDPSKVKSVLDLCTGSGCLAILAAMRLPKAKVDAADLSKDALAVARKNVVLHRMQRRVRLAHGDLFAPLAGRRYDLIVSNPPYVDARGMRGLPPECRHEPALAFDGGKDGIAVVRRIIEHAGRHLTSGGGLLCEVGRCRPALERAYPQMRFLWLDTEASSGEVFWLDATQLTVIPGRPR